MALKMNDFLKEFYNRLLFRDMSIEQFAQYCEYVKADDFNGNMKKWKDLLEKDPADPTGKTLLVDTATGLYVRKELPQETDLEPADWEKLYKAFQNAFRNMAVSRSSLNEKTVNFLDEYFGRDLTATPPISRMFDHATANARADNLIQFSLKDFLERHELGFKLNLRNSGILNDEFSFEDLIQGITSHKYNTDAKFQQRLIQVVEYIDGTDEGDLRKALKLGTREAIPDLTDIRTGFNTDLLNPHQLNNFRLQYDRLLKRLYEEPKIFDDFKNYDNGKISKSLTKAKEFLNYNDKSSDNYIKPKREDKLTIAQRLSEFVGDTYDDYLKKYVTLDGDRFFFSDEAKAIFAGLKKVKKTDGLDGLLKEAGNLESNLKAAGKFKASKHAKWFVDTLTEMQKDKNMSHIFAGAMKNSTHMKALVREIIFKAVKEDKIAEAKTALEVLSVMKYGYTTSKIMEVMRKEELKIFSDGGLSWNKNKGMQFVTTALDRSIKAAFLGVGCGITIVGNAIRLSNSKIKKTTGALNLERKNILQENQNALNSLNAQIAAEQSQIATMNVTINAHLSAPGVAPGTTADQYVANLNADITSANTGRQNALNMVSMKLGPVIQWLQSTASTDPNYDAVSDYVAAVMDAVDSNGTVGPGGLSHLPTGLTFGGVASVTIEADIVTALNDLRVAADAYNVNNDKLTEFTNARETLSALSAQLTRHQEETRNWDDNHHDKVQELINYWNLLETGRGTHSGPMYSWFGRKKSQEKKFEQVRADIISKAMENSITME